jgi:hypothetical protein
VTRTAYPVPVPDLEDIWVPLVDEPIGTIVSRIQEGDSELERLVGSPHRVLAFRTFAYIRVGLVLGQLLFDHDLPPYDGSEAWVDALLREPTYRDALAAEVHAVAREIDADPKYADVERVGPDEAARERFREFARKQLDSQ